LPGDRAKLGSDESATPSAAAMRRIDFMTSLRACPTAE
jgi:hypothetical protein